jgi:hypothetical protein
MWVGMRTCGKTPQPAHISAHLQQLPPPLNTRTHTHTHRRVLVRLTVVEASGLPALTEEAAARPDVYAGLNKSRSLHVPSIAQVRRCTRTHTHTHIYTHARMHVSYTRRAVCRHPSPLCSPLPSISYVRPPSPP